MNLEKLLNISCEINCHGNVKFHAVRICRNWHISLAIKHPSIHEVSAHETLHDSPSFPSRNASIYEVFFNKISYEIQSIHQAS